jgi:hypothetical protein
MKNPLADMPPTLRARIAGAFYVVTILGSIFSFVVPKAADVALGIAGLAYIGVTILFYYIFKPVNMSISMLAALLSFVGIAIPSSLPHSFSITMTFFGFYCILIGYLTVNSTYLPRLLGVFLAIGGAGYLINSFANILSLAFAPQLFPYILLPGFLAETVLCLWLLVKGVDVQRWQEKAAQTS